MSKRPKTLHYAGRNGEHMVGIPARDLTERDIASLTDEQLADATANHPRTGKALYREKTTKAPTPAKPPSGAVAAPQRAAGPMSATEPTGAESS